AVAAGDFNRDGFCDLATAVSVPNGAVSVLVGQGDGSFQTPPFYPVGGAPDTVVSADLNGDGIPHLVTGHVNGNVSVLLGNADGTFQPHMDFDGGAVFANSVAIGDFNGDGVPDLAVATSYTNNPKVSVLLGNGDGTFQPRVLYSTGPGFGV